MAEQEVTSAPDVGIKFLVKPRRLFLKGDTNAEILSVGEPLVEKRPLEVAAAVKELADKLGHDRMNQQPYDNADGFLVGW